MVLSELIGIVDRLAPPELALPGDRIGLMTGDPEQEVSVVGVALDGTEGVVDRAVTSGAQALLVHHPLIFEPLSSLAETGPQTRLLAEIVRSRLAVYVLHTNWDVARGGLNDALADKLGILDTSPLKYTRTSRLYKLIVYVPDEAIEQVRKAIGDAGAGLIGNYSHCSFRSEGTGTFLPLEGADPAIGKVGKAEEVREWRLETLVDEGRLEAVTKAMLDAHPYEEVAFDVVAVEQSGTSYGMGRVGRLDEPVTLEEFSARVSDALRNRSIRIQGSMNSLVARVAVCGGSGGDLLEDASASGADVFVTSEVKHHQLLLAQSLGLAIVDATHYATESVGMRHFARRLEMEFDLEVRYLD